MDLPYTVNARIPKFWRLLFYAYWAVTPAGIMIVAAQDGFHHGIVRDVAIAFGLTVLIGYLHGMKIPRRYEVREDGIRVYFGWPRRVFARFADGLEIGAKDSGWGFTTLDAAFDRQGEILIRRKRYPHFPLDGWRAIRIAVYDPEAFLKIAKEAQHRFRRMNGEETIAEPGRRRA
jgi:hypothetical protein